MGMAFVYGVLAYAALGVLHWRDLDNLTAQAEVSGRTLDPAKVAKATRLTLALLWPVSTAIFAVASLRRWRHRRAAAADDGGQP